jgi:hypothetical protein
VSPATRALTGEEVNDHGLYAAWLLKFRPLHGLKPHGTDISHSKNVVHRVRGSGCGHSVLCPYAKEILDFGFRF